MDEEELEVTNEEKSRIRNELSQMSFEDLQKIKEKMGSKLYNQAVFGVTKPKVKKVKEDFKRANKNRPREVSSKRRTKLRDLLKDSANPTTKNQPRDPRFDSLCGEFDKKAFKSSYKFVHDLRKKEKKILEEQLQETVDPEEKKKIKFLIQRLGNQIREREKEDAKAEQEMQEKLQTRHQLEQGQKPVYKKKSAKRLEEIVGKYEDLKQANRLEKYIEKKSRKIASREKKTENKMTAMSDDVNQ